MPPLGHRKKSTEPKKQTKKYIKSTNKQREERKQKEQQDKEQIRINYSNNMFKINID